jgi:hypothetical protein
MGFMAGLQKALVAEVIIPTLGGLSHKEKER